MLCFSAWQCAFMCIFLHACHADSRVGWGGGCFAFLLGSARLCVFFSTPVTRIDGLGGGGSGWGGVGGWGGLDSVLSPASCCIFFSTGA